MGRNSPVLTVNIAGSSEGSKGRNDGDGELHSEGV